MQSLKSKAGSSEQRTRDLSDRLLEFAVTAIKASHLFSKTQAAAHIAGQWVRSATSAGANYEEACGAQSRADFVHKLRITLKELREAVYWIKLSGRLGFSASPDWTSFFQESNEPLLIIGKSVATTKGVAK